MPLPETRVETLQSLADKWIRSSQEKVDVWTVSLRLDEDGRLERLASNGF